MTKSNLNGNYTDSSLVFQSGIIDYLIPCPQLFHLYETRCSPARNHKGIIELRTSNGSGRREKVVKCLIEAKVGARAGKNVRQKTQYSEEGEGRQGDPGVDNHKGGKLDRKTGDRMDATKIKQETQNTKIN